MCFKNSGSSINLFITISVVSFLSFRCYAYDYPSSYKVVSSYWTTLTSWKFPQDAFDVRGEGEILWANVYQLALAIFAIFLALWIHAKTTFVAAMFCFAIFGISHITAHATMHPWTYLPLHYSFVATGIFIGMTFGGIKSYATVVRCLLLDFFLIQGIGQFFGVLSAFGILCFGLRHHLRLMFTLAIGCGLIWFGLLFNDVLIHGSHGLTEVLACIGLSMGGIALIVHPEARQNQSLKASKES